MNPNQNRFFLYVILFGIFWTKSTSILTVPYLTIFLHNKLHISITFIGIIVGLQPFAICIGCLIGGYLSDIFKKRNILTFSILISGIVFSLFYVISFIKNIELQIIFFSILNLLNGFSSAFFSPVSRVLLAEFAQSPAESLKFMHLRYLAVNLSATIGPLLGAYFGIVGNAEAFLYTSFAYLIYFIFLLIIFNKFELIEKKDLIENKLKDFYSSFKIHLKNKPFFYLLICTTLFSIMYIQMNTNLAIIINRNIEEGTLFFSWMLTLNAATVVIFQPLIYLFTRKMPQKNVYFFGFIICLFSGISLFFFSISKISIICFVFTLTIAEILIFPISSVLTAELAGNKNTGVAFGLLELTNIGTAFGPFLGGILLQYFSLKSFAVGFIIIPLIILFFVIKNIYLNDSKPESQNLENQSVL